MKYLLVILLISHIAICDTASDAKQSNEIRACNLAIDACKDVVAVEDEQITALKKQVSTLESSLVDAQSSPIIPTWLVILTSVVGGVAIGYTVGHH